MNSPAPNYTSSVHLLHIRRRKRDKRVEGDYKSQKTRIPAVIPETVA